MLKKENLNHDGCDEGGAKLSGGYNLPAKYVISTVGNILNYIILVASPQHI